MTEKISFIPARLKNAAKGGHVAGADDIMDDELQLTQSEINSLVLEGAVSVGLTASPSVVLVGSESSIGLTTTCGTAADITISRGNTQLASGHGVSLSHTDHLTPVESGTTTYSASFRIGGLTKNATRNVQAVYPVRYGAGDSAASATTLASARTTPAGTYVVTVPSNGKHVYFRCPAGMTISKATMSGFDFPLSTPVDSTIDGVAYKDYTSLNTYDAGSLTIVIS